MNEPIQLSPGVRREGRSLYVPSRTRMGLDHKVTLTVDNDIICNCEAGAFGRECWAIQLVREELDKMTTEERMLPAVQVFKPESLLPAPSTYTAIDKAAALALAGAVALPPELKGNKARIAAVMLYGWELGLRPMTALQHLYIVNGRVQPSAQVMTGLLHARTDARISVVESTDKICTLRLIWPSRKINETWTCGWDEVVRAKLDKKDVWAAYPRDKLVWHTTKRLLRVYAPDIINGLDGPGIGAQEGLEDEYDYAAERQQDFENENDLYNPVIDAETGEILEEAQPAAEAVPGEPEGRGVVDSSDPEALVAPPPADESPSVEDLRAEILALMRETQKAWDKQDYARLYTDLKSQFSPANEAFAITTLDLESAQRCLAELRRMRGDIA